MRVSITKALVADVLRSVRNAAHAEVTYCNTALQTAQRNLLTYLDRDVLERTQWGALYDNFKAGMYPERWMHTHSAYSVSLCVSAPDDLPTADDNFAPGEYAAALEATRSMSMSLDVAQHFSALGVKHLLAPPDTRWAYVPSDAMKATRTQLRDLRKRVGIAEERYDAMQDDPGLYQPDDPRVADALQHRDTLRVALVTAEAEAKAAYGDKFFDGMPYPEGDAPALGALHTNYFAPQAASLEVLQAHIRRVRAESEMNRIIAGVDQILSQYPSLNKAVFAYPELRHYIPAEYIAKMNTPDKPRAPRQPSAPAQDDDDVAAPLLNPGDLTTMLAKAELIRGN